MNKMKYIIVCVVLVLKLLTSCQAENELRGVGVVSQEDSTHFFVNSTSGGTDGIILKVTNLNASGEGSLKAALDYNAKRIIVFEVGGIIDLNMERLNIDNPNVTIAGHTAPPPGITLIKGGIFITTHNVIIKHIAVRPGDANEPKQSSIVFNEFSGIADVNASCFCLVLVPIVRTRFFLSSYPSSVISKSMKVSGFIQKELKRLLSCPLYIVIITFSIIPIDDLLLDFGNWLLPSPKIRIQVKY